MHFKAKISRANLLSACSFIKIFDLYNYFPRFGLCCLVVIQELKGQRVHNDCAWAFAFCMFSKQLRLLMVFPLPLHCSCEMQLFFVACRNYLIKWGFSNLPKLKFRDAKKLI